MVECLTECSGPGPEVIKLFMLSSIETKIYPANKCYFDIYEQDKLLVFDF